MKIRIFIQALIYSPLSLWINFRHLPVCQAIKLPIIVGGGKRIRITGKIIIDAEVRPGMILLGFGGLPFYERKNLKIILEGTICFKGNCSIGNSCTISVPKDGKLVFGNNFKVTAGLRLACHKYIEFGENTLVGWGCTFIDSDMHALKNDSGKLPGRASIIIGNNNWICQGSTILKGSRTPDYTVVAACTVLAKDFSNNESRTIIAGNPARVVKRGVWHDAYDDIIDS